MCIYTFVASHSAAHPHKIHSHMAFRTSYIHLPPFALNANTTTTTTMTTTSRNTPTKQKRKQPNGIAVFRKTESNNPETWRKITKFKLQYCTHFDFFSRFFSSSSILLLSTEKCRIYFLKVEIKRSIERPFAFFRMSAKKKYKHLTKLSFCWKKKVNREKKSCCPLHCEFEMG